MSSTTEGQPEQQPLLADEPSSNDEILERLDSDDKPNGFAPTSSAIRPNRQPPAYVASLSPEERQQAETALVRKLDMRLIPPIIVMYVLNYLDRNAIASARLGGLEKDLNLQGSEYQSAVSALFAGYILIQVPSNLLMNKIGKPSLYLPIMMMIWGSVSTLTAAVQTSTGLLFMRFLLGFTESPFFPGALFLLSCFYTRKELALRTALLFSGLLISCTFAGPIAGAIVKSMDGLLGIAAWRWLFLTEGLATILLAFAAIPILPDMPATTFWLTPQQRDLAVWRLDEDIGQTDFNEDESKSFFSGFTLAVKDPKVWILTLLLFCMAFSSSVTNFFPTIVETLGFGPVASLILTTPPYVLGVIACTTHAWHSDRTGEKFLHIVLPSFLALLSFLLAATTTSITPRYIAMMLMIPACYMGYVVALCWIASTIPRPPAKRAAALALINAISNASSIFSSYLFPTSAGPRYELAFVVCGFSSFLAIVTASVLRGMLVRLNEELDKGVLAEDVVGGGGEGVPQEAAARGFRFSL